MAIVAKKKRGAALRAPQKGAFRLLFWVTCAFVLSIAVVLVLRGRKLEEERAALPAVPLSEDVAERGISSNSFGTTILPAYSPADDIAARPENAEPPKTTSDDENGWAPYPLPKGYVVKPGQMATPDGRILTFPPPKEGETAKVLSSGKIYVCDSMGHWKDATPRQLFGTAFEENFYALASSSKPFIPSFLLGLDEDAVVNVLQKDYTLKGDETEEELANLEAYLNLKSAALDFMEQGGTFDEFVAEMASFAMQDRQLKAKALAQIVPLWKKGLLDEARDKVRAFDAALEEQGFSPLRLPPHIEKDLK